MNIQNKVANSDAAIQKNQNKNNENQIDDNYSFKSGTLRDLYKAAEHEPEFILQPFLRQGEATLIYAGSGLGKSFYAAGLAVAIASGGDFIGYSAPKPRKVKYIDGEMSVHDLYVRIRSGVNETTSHDNLFRNLIISNRELHTDKSNHFPDISDKSFKQKIVRDLVKEKVEVVIFDNFSTLALGVEDENSAGGFNGTLELVLALKAEGILPILIHHSTKDGKRYRGTSKMEAVFSNIIGLHRDKGIDLLKGCGFSIAFDKNRSLHSKLTEVRAVQYLKDEGCWVDVESSLTKMDQLIEAIETLQYVNQKELAAGLGWSEAWVSEWLKRAFGASRLTQKKRNELFDLAKELRAEKLGENDCLESDF